MSYQTLIPIPDNLGELSAGSLLANPTGSLDFPVEVNLGSNLVYEISGGEITATTLSNAGSGYTDGTYLGELALGGTGSGASFDVVVAGGVITSVVINDPGVGYLDTDVLTLPGLPAGSGGEVTVDTVSGPTVYSLNAIDDANIESGVLVESQRSVSAADAFGSDDYLIEADATAGGFNVDLPPASNGKNIYVLKKVDGIRNLANAVFLVADGADLIDGEAQQRLRRYDAIKVISNGVDSWSII